MEKIKVGIFFGGPSREREISFAGGRTVYDNIDKSLFDPVPIFMDSLGRLILLDWSYIYKGSIRDFYPPASEVKASEYNFQVYIENVHDLDDEKHKACIESVGTEISFSSLSSIIDIAFLALHGVKGEDGSIQGLLEFLDIPYTGSGILPSAIGMNKSIQKSWMQAFGYASKPSFTIHRATTIDDELIEQVTEKLGFPLVVRPANQGSSIGVSILMDTDPGALKEAIKKAFFKRNIHRDQWITLDRQQKIQLVREWTDIREGIGLPVKINNKWIHHPDALFEYFEKDGWHQMVAEAKDGESEVIVEGFISGREFSCIVIKDENNGIMALPPTEIVKGQELYDYRSKYMPGLSRKKTPIDLEDEAIRKIQKECERLFKTFGFHTYARIDGFYGTDGEIYLNDPNTTSGMLPSSFFFHQAAEVGWNPSQFLSYIIRNSVAERQRHSNDSTKYESLITRLDKGLKDIQTDANTRQKVGIILGGYSFERHISVESGRNIYEKLASSTKYDAIPIFLMGDDEGYELYQIPINLLLKDNADDIKENILHFSKHTITESIKEKGADLFAKYRSNFTVLEPQKLDKDNLTDVFDLAFIALHGRPGEDGTIQQLLLQQGIPFNGSMPESAAITIHKYNTLQTLKKHGFTVTDQAIYTKQGFLDDEQELVSNIEQRFSYPFILKPLDDGCSSAVKVIKDKKQLHAFLHTMFRSALEIRPEHAETLSLKRNEEFPRKNEVLAEALIGPNGADAFLEITGGMITSYSDGEVRYEVFHPSEALAGNEILSLEEKFLAGEGQNITPARFATSTLTYEEVANKVKADLQKAAEILQVDGYCRIDAFVRIYNEGRVETVIIEINSLPGMTPATAIFHQSSLNNYKPFNFIDKILEYGVQRHQKQS